MSWAATYTTGTISVANGSTALAGAGTGWLIAGLANQANLLRAGNSVALVASVNSDTSITLTQPWGGTTLTTQPYELVQFPLDAVTITKELRDFIAKLWTLGITYDVSGDAPDDAIGNDGDRATKMTPGEYFIWLKVSGTWVPQPSLVGLAAGDIYDVVGFSPDQPGSGENILSMLMVRPVTFPIGLTGSRAKAGTAATSSAVFSVQKNGSQFGTILS